MNLQQTKVSRNIDQYELGIVDLGKEKVKKVIIKE